MAAAATLPAMKQLAMRICRGLLAMAALATPISADTPPPKVEVDGPFVRVMRNQDGSSTVFRRSPDNRTLTKKTLTAQGTVQSITIYRMDPQGNPRSCKIFDGQNQELFKVAYGYEKQFGRLVEERMFDARVKRIDPDNGGEMPVRRFLYTYDAQGNRSRPISISLPAGKRADDVYRVAPSALEHNPFDDKGKKDQPANPRAKPVGK